MILSANPTLCWLRFPQPWNYCQESNTGTLAYNASSGRWIWRQHYSHDCPSDSVIRFLYETFNVEGIVFKYTVLQGEDLSDDREPNYRVKVPLGQSLLFDVHTHRSFMDFIKAVSGRKIPSVPGSEGRRIMGDPAPGITRSLLGMMVDTSTRPSTYKLIVGNRNEDTLILDSRTNTWERKPSSMVRCRAPRQSSNPKSVMQCDGRMYIWSELDEIHVYSPEEDKWSTLNPPPRHELDEFRGLGHWQNEVHAVTKNEQATLSVWKLIDPLVQRWKEYARIPSDMFAHLLRPGALLPVVTTHCNEFLLMYVLTSRNVDFERLGRRFVLFNISNKRWETVTLPNTHLWKETL